MNLRHAATLALVGWYFLVAPVVGKDGQVHYDYAAPLSKWNQERAFDTADECEAYRTQLLKASKGAGTAATAILMDRCIASDDPRLKAN
jgi:hypothetical protein